MSHDLRIAPYVSNLDRSVFALQGLPEEVVAVLFAYYSRSRDDLRTNLSKLLAGDELGMIPGAGTSPAMGDAQEKARAFHEKWVVGYGHGSVAEHAVVHLAIEDVSIIASKVIEDLRLGSYTEKSTRYVVFDRNSYVDLPELPDELRAGYRASCEKLFEGYLALQPEVEKRVRELSPRRDGQSEAAWNAAVRAHVLDLLRGLLPAGTRTNLGLTANARALAMLISKMLSSPLAEVQRIAGQMRDESLQVAPTLLRHTAASGHRMAMPGVMAPLAKGLARVPDTTPGTPVRLVRFDTDALERVVLALAYEHEGMADASARLQASRGEPREKLIQLVETAMRDRGQHDPAPRAFEASSITMELELDYGAYRDLQRHRMLSPMVRPLGCELGVYVSEDLEAMGHGERVRELLGEARAAWEAIAAGHPLEAQYAVPLAYRVRALWTMNLRELFHVVELRSRRQGHASYRRVAQEMYRAVIEVHPWLEKLIRVDLESYRLARA